MLPFRCLSGPCRESGKSNGIFYLPEKGPCPSCGLLTQVHQLTVIHLLVPDPNGIVPPSLGDMPWQPGCEQGVRDWKVRGPAINVSFTVSPQAATCHACLNRDQRVLPEPKPEPKAKKKDTVKERLETVHKEK